MHAPPPPRCCACCRGRDGNGGLEATMAWVSGGAEEAQERSGDGVECASSGIVSLLAGRQCLYLRSSSPSFVGSFLAGWRQCLVHRGRLGLPRRRRASVWVLLGWTRQGAQWAAWQRRPGSLHSGLWRGTRGCWCSNGLAGGRTGSRPMKGCRSSVVGVTLPLIGWWYLSWWVTDHATKLQGSFVKAQPSVALHWRIPNSLGLGSTGPTIYQVLYGIMPHTRKVFWIRKEKQSSIQTLQRLLGSYPYLSPQFLLGQWDI